MTRKPFAYFIVYFLLAALLISAVPIAMGQEGEKRDSGSDTVEDAAERLVKDTNTGDDDTLDTPEDSGNDSGDPKKQAVDKELVLGNVQEREIVKEGSMERCRERIRAKFPNVADARIEAQCAKLLSVGAGVREKKEFLRQMIQEKLPEYRTQRVEAYAINHPEIKEFVQGLSTEQLKKFIFLDRATQKELIALEKAVALEKLDSLELKRIEDAVRGKREVVKEKLDRIRQDYQKAKDDFLKFKGESREKQKLFLEFKEKEQACGESETAECAEARQKAVDHAKEYLTRLADMLISTLEKLRLKVEESGTLTEAEVKDYTAKIEAKIAELTAAKARVESAATKEEVKLAGRAILDIWAQARVHFKLASAGLYKEKVGEIISQSQALERKLDRVLAKMGERNISTGNISGKIDEFSSHIKKARENYAAARQIYDEVRALKLEASLSEETRADLKARLEKADTLLKEAHDELKKANAILRTIIHEITGSGGSIRMAEEDEREDTSEDFVTVSPGEDDLSAPPLLPAEEGEILTESDLATVTGKDCWKDKPDYTPGKDKGYFIWQGTCAHFWWIDWSGDTRTAYYATAQAVKEKLVQDAGAEAKLDANIAAKAKLAVEAEEPTIAEVEAVAEASSDLGIGLPAEKRRMMYEVKGVITTNGRFMDVGTRRFDAYDTFKVDYNRIEFKARVGPHFDGLFFRTTGNKVMFDLEYDGKKETGLIFIGKQEKNPKTNPFVLEGMPAKPHMICDTDEVVFQDRCVKSVRDVDVEVEVGCEKDSTGLCERLEAEAEAIEEEQPASGGTTAKEVVEAGGNI